MPKPLGHGGHGLPTPPPAGFIAHTRPQGALQQQRARISGQVQAQGGRQSTISIGKKLTTPHHIGSAILRAQHGQSAIDPKVLNYRGFSTATMRRAVNNILAVEHKVIYLEAGAYCGATACAAVSNRPNVTAFAYEDFSQPFAPEGVDVAAELANNVKKTVGGHLTVITRDFFMSEKPGGVDVYFYDGKHDEDDQALALPAMVDLLSPKSIFMVDDFNWESVEKGTKRGFAQVEDKVKILAKWILRGQKDQDDPIWHNGFAIYLLGRK